MKKVEFTKLDRLTILTAVIITITFIAGLFFIYMPFRNKNMSLRTEILYERDRNILIGKIRALNRHYRAYSKRIPETRTVSWLLNEISDMASKEKIQVLSVKPGMSEDRGMYTRLLVVLDVVSTYHDIGRFIANIESSEKFLKIETIDMKRLDTDDAFDKTLMGRKPFDIKANIVISTIAL